MTIADWLKHASDRLIAADIASGRLDAELILAHTIRKPRIYLHANDYLPISSRSEEIANARLDLRLDRTPIAYIVGHKEFYGRQFKTTPAALIPRPESEALIELLKKLVPENTPPLSDVPRLVDVGTGTGCLGISAKLELPKLDVTLIDISNHALNLAKENAQELDARVTLLRNDLLRGYGLPIDIVIANLPYVDRSWQVSPETRLEPGEALFADDGGLALVYELIEQSTTLLQPGALLLLESDDRQIEKIIDFAGQHAFTHIETSELITAFKRR